MDQASGLPKSFGYLEVAGPEAADRMVRMCNGIVLYKGPSEGLMVKMDSKTQAAVQDWFRAYNTHAERQRLLEQEIYGPNPNYVPA